MYPNFPPPGTEVALYGRYSDDKQNPKSVDDQFAECRQLIARHGWTEVAAFRDEARTGATIFHRTGIREMLQAAREGQFQLLLMESQDRVSRDQADTHVIFRELGEHGISAISLQDGVLDSLKVTFNGYKAQRDLEQNSARVKRGHTGAVKSGRICGSISYGHRKKHTENGENGHREIDPKTSAIVVRAMKEFAGGCSPQRVCNGLNAEGIRAPRGGRWQPSVLYGSAQYGSGLFRNRMYIGEFEFRRTRRRLVSSTGKVKTEPGRKEERIVIQLPELRIVSDELWNAVQERLAANSAAAHKPLGERRRPDYVFSKKLVCGRCGCTYVMLGKRLGCSGRTRLNMDCPNSRRVQREDLEEAVFRGLADHLRHPALLTPYIEEYTAEAARIAQLQTAETEQAQSDVAGVDTRIDNLMRKLTLTDDDGPVAKRIIAEMQRLEDERQKLKRRAKRRPPKAATTPASPDAVLDSLERMIATLQPNLEGDASDAAHARDILRDLIDKIVIEPVEVAVEDGRGAGPVRLTVIGRLTELLKLSETTVGRVSLVGSPTETYQAHANLRFRFSVTIQSDDPRLTQMRLDRPVIKRLLDDSDGPVRHKVFNAALLEPAHAADAEAVKAIDLRVRNVLHNLQRHGQVRSVRLGQEVGWVWNHRTYTDDEWRARDQAPKPEGYSMPVVRVQAPEAIVTIIEEAGAWEALRPRQHAEERDLI